MSCNFLFNNFATVLILTLCFIKDNCLNDPGNDLQKGHAFKYDYLFDQEVLQLPYALEY